MRKYFFFGPDLDPDYRQRMYDAAKIWTADDPRPSFELVASLTSDDPAVREYALEVLRQYRENIAALDDVEDRYADEDLGDDHAAWQRWWKQYADRGWQVFEDVERRANPFPHPRHGVGTGPVGGAWDPPIRGTRADARNTDNLRAMRETSIYLMAEETGNETVRRLYKDKIQRFVANLYRVGNGEWDSENYLHHTIAPYHNLYDFAEDDEVVALAKAALDWLYTASAVKYYRGHAVAPTKRTGGGLARFVQIYFGDRPTPEPQPYGDLFHVITSAYRPPLAVVAVGQGEFDRPAELINTKPTYSYWLPGQAESPETWETVFYGKSYYLGSAVSTSSQGDVRPWDMLMNTRDGGARHFRVNSGTSFNGMRPGDQIGHYRNLVVWLRPADGKPFTFQLPGEANVSRDDGVWFVEHDQTYLAIRPIHLDAAAVQPAVSATRGDVRFTAQPRGDHYAGFALEAADAVDHDSFNGFKQAVRSQSELDLSHLADGAARLQGLDGRTLEITHNPDRDMPLVKRDGELYKWSQHLDVYGPQDDNAPVLLRWGGGTLRVDAGGHVFEQTVHDDGTVEFTAE
ncbi:MAG: hypothetical protein WD534_02555 [Phycisphaeraceae bacterium]